MQQIDRKLLTFKVTDIGNYHLLLTAKKLMIFNICTDEKILHLAVMHWKSKNYLLRHKGLPGRRVFRSEGYGVSPVSQKLLLICFRNWFSETGFFQIPDQPRSNCRADPFLGKQNLTVCQAKFIRHGAFTPERILSRLV